jgi:hypothetical protein
MNQYEASPCLSAFSCHITLFPYSLRALSINGSHVQCNFSPQIRDVIVFNYFTLSSLLNDLRWSPSGWWFESSLLSRRRVADAYSRHRYLTAYFLCSWQLAQAALHAASKIHSFAISSEWKEARRSNQPRRRKKFRWTTCYAFCTH